MIEMRNRRMVAAVFATFVLVFGTLSMVGMGTEPGEEFKSRIVLVSLEGEGDVNRIRSAGGEILERYPDRALVEITGEAEGKMNSLDVEITDRLSTRTRLSVKGHEFDIEEGMPEFSDELTIDAYEEGEKGLYVVHMLGPIHPDWRSELKEMDVDMLDYVPNYAYEIYVTPEKAEKVEELEFVDWVDIYQPGFKLAEDIEPGLINIQFTDGSGEIKEVEDRSRLKELARIPEVYYISNYQEPELHGEVATQNIGGGNWIWDPDDDPYEPWRGHNDEYDYGAHVNHLGYEGDGVEVAVADTGIIDHHPDFQDRFVGGISYASGEDWNEDGSGHGTHVAGSVAADTYEGTGDTVDDHWDTDVEDYLVAQGMAPESELFIQKVFDNNEQSVIPSDASELILDAREESDAYVHSNSWGSDARGAYQDSCSEFDSVVRDAGDGEPMVITVSAGNEGEGPSYETTGSPANAKNVIAVGASETFYPGLAEDADDYEGDPDRTATFSSRGWTEDGRVKPDVIAPGMYTFSTYIDEDDPDDWGYAGMGGTSMSNPAVAGAAALVTEWFEDNYGSRPSPSMVKALMINTAYEMEPQDGDYYTSHIPNRDEGWGQVDLTTIMDPPVDFMLEDQDTVLETGEEEEHEIEYIDGDEPLKISTVWTDSEAEAGADPTLRNDLNLEVETPGGEIIRGNAFDLSGDGESDDGYTYPEAEVLDNFDGSGDGWDDRNNVQNVYINSDELEPGTYTVTVRAENVPEPVVGDGQDYSLVKYNAVDADQEGPMTPTEPEPEDGATGIGTEVDLSALVEHYEGDPMDVEFYDGADNLIGTDDDVPSGDRAEVTWDGLDHDTTYEWYVVAEDADGETAQSSVWSFTTLEEPGPFPPSDPDPADGATGVTTEVDLSALVEHEEGDPMDVEFYDGADNLIGTDDDVPSGDRAEVTWDGLDHDTTYEWYVVAEDADGETAQSSVWSFTTEEEVSGPLPPTEPEPEDEATEVDTDVELSVLVEHESETTTDIDSSEGDSMYGEPPTDHRPPAQRERAEEIIIRWDWAYEDYHTDKAVAISGETTVQVVAESAGDADDIEDALDAAGADMDNVSTVVIETDSHWIRDYGPMPIVDKEDGEVSFLNMEYAGAAYRPDDNEFPRNYGDEIGVDYYDVEEDGEWFTIDGGHKFVEGSGILYTTDDVYDINTNIGGEEEVEQMAREWFNLVEGEEAVETVSGDYGLAHLDMQVNILDETTVLVSEFDDPSIDPDAAELLDDTADFFENEITARNGESFEVERLPMHVEDGWGGNTYYTHANSLIVNDIVLVPEFGYGTDTEAISIYEDILPDHDIIGIDAVEIADMGGAIHCTTREIPEDNAPPSIEISQVSASPDENVVVEAEIETDAAMDTAHVYYDTNGADDLEKIEMYHVGGDSYEAELDSYSEGTVLNYFIRVEDDFHAVTYEGDAWDPHTDVVEDILMDVTFYDAYDDTEIDTVEDVSHGERASVMWDDLDYNTEYEWYSVADDGEETTTSDTWSFITKEDEDVDSVVIDPEQDQVIDAGEELVFDAEAMDGEGNVIEDDPEEFDWQNADIGVFYETEVGDYDVTATYDGVESDTTTVTVEPGETDDFEISPKIGEITAGESQEYTATAYDEWGNDFDVTGETTWSDDIDDSNWVENEVTAYSAGEWSVTGEYDTFDDTASLDVEPAPVETVTIYPEEDQTVAIGEELVFDAEAEDEYGNLITEDETEFTWQNADNGVFYEEVEGDYDVTATYDGETSPITVVTVESETYTLTIDIEGEGSTDPAEGTHTYDYGEQVTVTATPSEGWYFEEWTGDHTGTEEEIDITMDGDKEITANFEEEEETYDLTINVEGEGSTDPAEGTHTYVEGEEVTITATPSEGWDFEEWTGDHEGTEEEIDITMDDDKEVTAHFEELEYYELTVNIEGEGTVDVDPEQEEYEEGTEVTLEAIPEEDWYFVEWTGDHEGRDREITVIMDSDKTLTAHFEEVGEDEYVLTIKRDGEGTTEPEPGDHIYDEGDEVTVEAIADEGWYFVEWTGDHTGTEEEITITMDEDKQITAVFELHVYTLDVSIEGEGEVDVYLEQDEYEHGTEVVLTAVAYEGWYFEEWTGDHTGTEEEISIVMDDDKDITAHFEELEYYELTVNIEGEGTVDVEPEQEEYEEGTEVTLTAIPDEDWYFEGWTGDYEGRGREITVIMDADKTLTATFEEVGEDEHVLTINRDGEGTTEPEPGDHIYDEGDEVTIEAIADEGWYFVEWTGDHTGTEEEITITMDEDKEITAVFELHVYTLDISIEGEGDVDVNPEQDEYEHGTEVELTAVADEGWYFEEWTGDYEGTEEEISIVMDDDKEVTAHFEEILDHLLTINVEGEGSTDPEEGTHTYEDGEEVTITATADEGWWFDGWTGDVPEDEEEEEEISIVMDDDKEVTAHFEEVEYYGLTVNTDGDGTVDVDPEQEEYEEGTKVTLTAEPDENWYFDEWTGDYTGTDEEITITMEDDKEITAVFEKEEELEPAYFEVEIIEYDDEVDEGQTITVTFLVTNTGDEEGTQEIVLYVNGEIVKVYEDEITLGPGEDYESEITFDAADVGDGEHELEVRSDDEASEPGDLEVMADEDEGIMANYWWLIVLLLIIIIVLVVFMFVMAGEEEEEEEDVFEEPGGPPAEEEPSFDHGFQEEEYGEEEYAEEEYGEEGYAEEEYAEEEYEEEEYAEEEYGEEEEYAEEDSGEEDEVFDEQLEEEFEEEYSEEE